MDMQPKVELALARTNDLLDVDPSVLTEDAELWQLLRFFFGPPVSEENLWTFLGGRRKFKGAVPLALAPKFASVLSNTPKNSWKRLNQETVGKSNTWREHLGDRVVTACVLAGVYDLASLVQAQEQGTTIFWEHDLSPLVDFIG